MKGLKLLAILILIAAACERSPYENYAITESGMSYRLHKIGDDSGELPQPGDFVLPSLIVSDTADSIIYTNLMSTGNPLVHQVSKLRNGGLNEAFSMLYEGDSASFIMEGKGINLDKLCDIPGLNGQINPVKISVKMNEILTPQEVDSLKRMQEWLKDEEMNEQIRLNNFLKENKIDQSQFINGIYFISQKEGSGRQASGGSHIRVHYRAYFIDGTLFDNTYEYSNALEVDLGKPDQLLEGFEIGIRMMKEGGKATFVIPSQLAFGEQGSSTGIVQPYSSLIYEVELIDVQI